MRLLHDKQNQHHNVKYFTSDKWLDFKTIILLLDWDKVKAQNYEAKTEKIQKSSILKLHTFIC